MKLFFTSVFLLQMAVASTGQAQVTTMSLMGNVQSEDRRALSGAAVTVVHMPSGVRHAAASDGAGRFMIPNLMVGGPYLIRVGEGGYRSQTVENIFLEAGKTASFTVVLSKIPNEDSKGRNNRPDATASNGTTMTLANEAVVGGPVLITLSPNKPQSAGATLSSRSVPAPAPAGTASMPAGAAPAAAPKATPGPAASPVAYSAPVAAPATAAGSASTSAPSTSATPAYKRRYPVRRAAATRSKDPIVPGHFDARSGNYIYETGPLTTLKLAGGKVVSGVGVNSTENNLYRFLANPQMQVDTMDLTNGWYNFDRVFFNPGKASLTKESLDQLRNVATILQAFPNARIKLGGYTDSTGTYKVNRQLSEARARTAWASLVDMGISPSRIDARGYGRNYAIAPNTTEEGRAKNRRLSVKVLQK